MAIYKDIRKELDQTVKKAHELKLDLQKKCPHNHITMNSYVNDDWARFKKYTVTYQCDFCGLYASYDQESMNESSDNFNKMKKLYDKQKAKKLKLRS